MRNREKVSWAALQSLRGGVMSCEARIGGSCEVL